MNKVREMIHGFEVVFEIRPGTRNRHTEILITGLPDRMMTEAMALTGTLESQKLGPVRHSHGNRPGSLFLLPGNNDVSVGDMRKYVKRMIDALRRDAV